ncbi:MAG: hypothetical protein WA989_03370 [Henriciella sp.]|uniref:hypothetical protein n=1 Tax=Henriciella sp. TaxID=1968823 RepID=UPI003C7427BF
MTDRAPSSDDTPSEPLTIGAAELDVLRERIMTRGLCAADFQTLIDGNRAAFQRIFGERVLLKVEFDVALFGEHSHLVYVPEGDAFPQIITAFPEGGKLRVGRPVEWHGSLHSPTRRDNGRQRVGIIAEDFSPDDWRKVTILAEAIDEAGLNYNFVTQNSNSVVATLADAAETGFVDLPGGGLNLGAGNLLYDELMGGVQWPRFLVRGGTSHSGDVASPVPKAMPQSSQSDG